MPRTMEQTSSKCPAFSSEGIPTNRGIEYCT